jgi:hypothetical protein
MSPNYRPKKPPKTKIDYGMDYIGAVEDPMDLAIAAALRATGDEYNRRHGKNNMPTERIKISDAGAGMRVFTPAGENTIAISMDMDEDDADEPPPAATESPMYTAPPLCKYCNEAPCVLTQCDEALDDTKTLYEFLMWRGEEMMDAGHHPKEIRFELYKVASRFRDGLLGKGYRIELPLCVTGDIRDAFPAKGGNYTGFKKGFLN